MKNNYKVGQIYNFKDVYEYGTYEVTKIIGDTVHYKVLSGTLDGGNLTHTRFDISTYFDGHSTLLEDIKNIEQLEEQITLDEIFKIIKKVVKDKNSINLLSSVNHQSVLDYLYEQINKM